jgi:hypothetical protein
MGKLKLTVNAEKTRICIAFKVVRIAASPRNERAIALGEAGSHARQSGNPLCFGNVRLSASMTSASSWRVFDKGYARLTGMEPCAITAATR